MELTDDWDMARAGHSSLEGAYQRSAIAEAASLLELAVHAWLWDLNCVYPQTKT